jgi:hypothetical protein
MDAGLQLAVGSLAAAIVLREAEPIVRQSLLAGMSFYGGFLVSQPLLTARTQIITGRIMEALVPK